MFNWTKQLLQAVGVGKRSNLGDLFLILDDDAVAEKELLPVVKEFFQDETQLGHLSDCYCVIALKQISKNTTFRIKRALEILSGLGDLTELIDMAIVNIGLSSEKIGNLVASITLWNDGTWQIDYVHVLDNDDVQFNESAKKLVEKTVERVFRENFKDDAIA